MSLIKCPVPILQGEWELEKLINLYLEEMPNRILEIGSFYGGTLWYWLKYGIDIKTIVSVDLPIPESDKRYKKMVECRKLWSSWIKGDTIFHFISGDSMDEQTISRVLSIFKQKTVDWLFIDGGHSEDNVHADYVNYSQLVRKDGLIVFHDILYERGVKMFWNKIRYKKTYY